SSTSPVSSTLLNSCLSQLSAWHVPPHWSKRDWFEEMRAQSASAAWHALVDYDASRHVPIPAFIHRRMIASALTRYRQEWSYAFHCACQADEQERQRAGTTEDSPLPPAVRESLRYALAQLSKPERWLIGQLFWEGYTEAEIAQSLGISHQAVSKRKRAVLQVICARLGVEIKK